VQIGWRVCYKCQHVEACLCVLATCAATFGGRTPPLAIVLEAKQHDLLVGTMRGVVGGARRPIFLFSFSYLFFLSSPWNLWCSIKKTKLSCHFFISNLILIFCFFFVLGSYLELIFFLISSFDIKLVRNWISWFFYEVITVSWPWLRVWNTNPNWHQSPFSFFLHRFSFSVSSFNIKFLKNKLRDFLQFYL
jgi:hypothetical protein